MMYYWWQCQKCGDVFPRRTKGEPHRCPRCRDRGVKSYDGRRAWPAEKEKAQATPSEPKRAGGTPAHTCARCGAAVPVWEWLQGTKGRWYCGLDCKHTIEATKDGEW